MKPSHTGHADPSATDAEALGAHDVWLRYSGSDEWAVAGANGNVDTGSVTALVGPNGAGKTSLIRCWMGFERPNRGDVRVFGHDPIANRREKSWLSAHLPQEPSLYAGLSALDHFDLVKAQRPSFDIDLGRRLLRDADVPADIAVRKLSGGQRVRVALALVMATRCKVLILDEPLANLDPLARRDVMAELAEHARGEGSTVLNSSHLVGELEGAFSHVIVMSRGQIVLMGSVNQVTQMYRTRLVANDREEANVRRWFHGRDGARRILIPVDEAGEPDEVASLEDVVIGMLAEARSETAQHARA